MYSRSLKLAFVSLLCLTILNGCQCEKSKGTLEATKLITTVVDTPEERQAQALRVIANYPMAEWEADLLARISKFTGTEVSKEVESRVVERLTQKDILERRVSLLTENYTAENLATLAELYSTAEGKGLLKRVLLYDEKLRERLAPIITEVLSNSK